MLTQFSFPCKWPGLFAWMTKTLLPSSPLKVSSFMRVFLSSGYYGSRLQVFGMPFQYISSNLTISVEFYWIIILGMSSYSIPLVFFFTASYYNYGGSSLPGFPYLTFFLKFPFNPLCCLFPPVTFSPLSFICEMFSFFFLSWALWAFSYSPVVLFTFLFVAPL